MSNKNPESLSKMKAGDVLVSHSTAVREHEISVVPDPPHAMSPTDDEAVSDARSEADVLQDQTDAIVRITTRTICGTDLHILKGDVPSVATHHFALADIMQAYDTFAHAAREGALTVILSNDARG